MVNPQRAPGILSKRRARRLQWPALSGALAELPLVIVDVETTGQSAAYGRVIEVAMIRLESGRVAETFDTLVNPGVYISSFIEGLTGITNDAVEDAPAFSALARKLYRILDGAVFVAHNARFDYSFLKAEFARVGIPFSSRCLCTVKLSRKLFPGERHHDLSSVIERNHLKCEGRHRAMGDAKAVLEFLNFLISGREAGELEKVVREILKSSSLPPGVDKATLDGLPQGPGVYLLYGKAGELLYVGKSVNLRDRVRSHFTVEGASGKELAMRQQIDRVEYRQTVGELGALLLESQLIKELRPIYNTMARQARKLIVARQYADSCGYHRISLEEIDHIDPGDTTMIMAVFKHRKQAAETLAALSKTHQLCHKLLGLEETRSYCFPYHLNQCRGACAGEEPPHAYNFRLAEAFAERRVKAWPFNGGIGIDERSSLGESGELFLVDNWCLLSRLRYSEDGIHGQSAGPQRFDYDSYKILSRYLLGRRHRRNIRLLTKEELTRLLSLES
jgi:DNA polymerase-3 subunit epsilon